MESSSKYCTNCCQLYYLKTLSPEGYEHLPVFLACGHTMCHNCVYNILKFEEPLACRKCNQEVVISPQDRALVLKNKNEFNKYFPINVFMLGEITMEHLKPNKEKEVMEKPYFIDLDAIIKSNEITKGQCKECQSPSNKMCKQCATILCLSCFNKSHKNFIVFKNHMLQNLEVNFGLSNCKMHQNRPLEYYCKTCTKPICVDCLLLPDEKSCKNHDFVSIQQVNEGFLADITASVPKIDELYRRFTDTAVNIGKLLQDIQNESNKSDFTNLLSEVEEHYSKLISRIKTQKDVITSTIIKVKTAEIESLLKVRDNIENGIKKTKQFSNIVDNIDHSQIEKVNLAAILDDAKEILNMSWYLKKEEADDNFKLTVNEDVCDKVKDYVRLEGSGTSIYKLCTTQELETLGIEIPPAPSVPVHPPILVKDVRQEKKKEATKPLVLYRNAPTFKSKSGSNSSINSIASETNAGYGLETFTKLIVQPVSPHPASEGQHPKLKEDSQEVIYISHIIDPHNFYVQRACHQSRVQDLLREFRNGMSLPRPTPNHVSEGKVYLMHNEADNLWMRCRIVSIERKNPHKIKYVVFCIDFGCSEIVTIEHLRVLPPVRVHSPPAFAIHCCLANCQPKNGSWTSEDSFLIQNIVDNSRAVITVRRIRSMAADSVTLEVDVTTLEHGVSLAHALVFHSRAYIPERLPYRKLPQCMEKLKIFENNNHFQRSAEEEIYITHVESPDKFYIRTLHQQTVYQDVCDELEQEFGVNDKVAIIYLPQKDMVCAVDAERYKARKGGRWERARVTETPGRGRVRVFLLDSGSTLLVHWKALRRLTKQLTVRQALATECNLAGITPANRKWSAESVNLMKRFQDQLLKAKVEEARSHGSLGVRLFHTDNDETICINDMMVHRKYAIAFGLTMFKEDLSEKYHDYSYKVPEVCTTENKPETSTEAINKGPLRLEVKILNCKSPSQIYVSLVQQQAAFDELYDEIQNYYKKTDLEPKDNWKVGDRCCSLASSSKRWRRVAILEIVDTNAKVFYCDFACVEIVPLTGLREVPEKFSSIGDGAIQCHLFGIMPAGQEWPSVTKEYLCELLDAYSRIFITKTGKFIGKSMPVQLWVYHTIPGGALDPDISEWRCLNNRIVEQGLAIPDKSEMVLQESSEGAGDLSFLNMTGSIRDWLQLEPIPTKSVKVDPAPTTTTPTLEVDTGANAQEDIAPTSSDMRFEIITDWLPPEPITKKEFIGVPTYIDNKGVIFLHDIDQGDSLALIQKALNARFQDTDPRAKFAKWSIGEPCIAQYFLDNQFYRGRVLEVNNEASSCLIHYVDYGNEEICSFQNLRKSIALYQFPIQAHKFTLSRIQPKGKDWETKALDFVHKMIVEKECCVKITGDPIGEITPIDLNYNQLCINDHLVDFELAQYADGSKPIIRVFASNVSPCEVNEDLDSGPEYIAEDSDDLDNPAESVHLEEGKCTSSTDWNEMMDEFYESKEFVSFNYLSEFKCEVSDLSPNNQVELDIILDDDKKIKYQEMYSELQKDSLNMNPINGIIENKACVAIFPDDGKWYRAILLQCSQEKGLVKVKYVDYGNEGIISIADVREITDKYLLLPPTYITAKLYNVKINPEIDRQTILDAMVDVLHSVTVVYHAKILKDDNGIPSVELRNEDNTLAYDVLFENNIFLRSE